MFESFGAWLNQTVLVLVGGNQEAVGIVTAVVLSTLIYSAKRLPYTIYRAIKRRIVKTIVIDDSMPLGSQSIKNFNSFIYRNRSGLFTQKYSNYSGAYALPPGVHFLLYSGKLWSVVVSIHEPTGSRREACTKVSISTVTFSKKLMDKTLKEITTKKPYEGLSIYQYTSDGSRTGSSVSLTRTPQKDEKGINNLVYNAELENTIINDIGSFLDRKQWYEDKGIPYRKTYMLEGPPGTGKTSLIKFIALKYGIVVTTCSINNPRISEAITSTGDQLELILIEDVDRCGKANKSSFDNDNFKNDSEVMHDLGTVLNTFDGIVPIKNRIIIFTTNHVTKLDDAFLRPGRIDKIVHVGYLETSDIVTFLERNYGDVPESIIERLDAINGNIRTCDVFTSWKVSPESIEGFVDDLSMSIDKENSKAFATHKHLGHTELETTKST